VNNAACNGSEGRFAGSKRGTVDLAQGFAPPIVLGQVFVQGVTVWLLHWHFHLLRSMGGVGGSGGEGPVCMGRS
jgi:hypothetical protein